MAGEFVSKDPSASTDHLTSRGKRRHRRVNKVLQTQTYELAVDLRANELIDTRNPSPGQNLKPKEVKIMGVNTE